MRRRVWFALVEPPCTTGSIALQPATRSIAQPLGIDTTDNKTVEGNLHILQAIVLVELAASVGAYYMLETSGTNRFRHGSLWIRLENVGSF